MACFSCLALVLAGVSCRERPVGPRVGAEPLPTNAVARVGEAFITKEALERELETRGGRAGKEAVLQELIAFQALLQEARAAGYDRDPGLVAAWEGMLVARFQEDRLGSSEGAGAKVEEAEVRDFYERSGERYRLPERSRAGVIFWQLSPKATAEKRAELAERAAAVRREAAKCDAVGFQELVRQHSEDQATRYRGGDTGWLKLGEPDLRWEPAVVSAIWSLDEPGAVSPVLTGERGMYVVRLAERQPAGRVPFEGVREAIAYQLGRQRQQDRQSNLIAGAKSRVQIEVHRELLDSVRAPKVGVGEETVPPGLPGQ